MEYVATRTAYVRQIFTTHKENHIHMVAVSDSPRDLKYLAKMIDKDCGMILKSSMSAKSHKSSRTFMEESNMNQDQSQTLSQIVESITGYKVNDKRGGKFYFNIYLSQSMSDTPIEALDLSVRAYHSLQRAGYSKIGTLAEAIADGVEISKIRNCGSKSCREIMEKLFLYQYNALPQEKRAGYVKEVMQLNAKKRSELSNNND